MLGNQHTVVLSYALAEIEPTLEKKIEQLINSASKEFSDGVHNGDG